ncbi:MAG: DUF512 domain-containing protein, partial [Calditrichaeota bacterium]
MMTITAVEPGSIGSDLNLQPGDRLLKINGHKVKDILDYRFLVVDDHLEVEVEQRGERIIFEIEKDTDELLGLEFEPLKVRMCGNDCPFCFVDQNPTGMRKGLYFRDEDYRLSFLSGHYVTMTNLSKADLDKIVAQRLSPLYISVHAIRPEVRKFLLGIRHEDRLLQKMDYLTAKGIELHTQIVVCPTINDGEILDETVAALAKYFPAVRSIALVPLGLTRHRQGLTPLKPVTADYARELIAVADRYARQYRQQLGTHLVYPSDEFYIMAGMPIPARQRYDAFEQLENGVGMVRTFLDKFAAFRPQMPKSIPRPARVTLVTAALMEAILRQEVVAHLNKVANLQAEVLMVPNRFYGETIRVTGLLTGQDIFASLSQGNAGDHIYLPRNCVNDEGLFLDDWRLEDLQQR